MRWILHGQTERFAKECYGGMLIVTAWFEFPNLRLGTIGVTMNGARGLKAADHVLGREDTSDPFAVVSVVQKRDSKLHIAKLRTEKVDRTLNPNWIDPSTGRAPVMYFDIWDRESATLYIDLYDADLASDDYLGQAQLDLNEYCVTTDASKQLELPITPFVAADGRALAQKHVEVLDVSGTVLFELTFDLERTRREYSDERKLDRKLKAAMATQGLSDTRQEELCQASAEAKLQFIKFTRARKPVVGTSEGGDGSVTYWERDDVTFGDGDRDKLPPPPLPFPAERGVRRTSMESPVPARPLPTRPAPMRAGTPSRHRVPTRKLPERPAP